jgi:hypothetical protein
MHIGCNIYLFIYSLLTVLSRAALCTSCLTDVGFVSRTPSLGLVGPSGVRYYQSVRIGMEWRGRQAGTGQCGLTQWEGGGFVAPKPCAVGPSGTRSRKAVGTGLPHASTRAST